MKRFSEEHLTELKNLTNETLKAKKALDKASEIRFKLGFNATRARITTVNARLSTNAEDFDRKSLKLLDFIRATV